MREPELVAEEPVGDLVLESGPIEKVPFEETAQPTHAAVRRLEQLQADSSGTEAGRVAL